MALKATIYKADLTISDMDRGYYASHGLTLAQHPSETLQRLMLRVAAFALHADEALAFTKGISEDDEPDLWRKNYGDEILDWIELGEPDEKRLRKACGRAEKVWIYSYGGRGADVWWKDMENKVQRFQNLTILSIDTDTLAGLEGLCARGMQLNATIQDGQLWLSDGHDTVSVTPQVLKPFQA